MSKASEWAKARPDPFQIRDSKAFGVPGLTIAMVDEVSGGMLLNEEPPDRVLTPAAALFFARWIIETFAEAPTG